MMACFSGPLLCLDGPLANRSGDEKGALRCQRFGASIYRAGVPQNRREKKMLGRLDRIAARIAEERYGAQSFAVWGSHIGITKT